MKTQEFIKNKVKNWKDKRFGSGGELIVNYDELEQWLEEYAEQNQSDDYELERLYDWVTNEKRERAQTKFTSGKTRDIAREIEYRLYKKAD